MGSDYISLNNLERMPNIAGFEKICKSIAMIDAILMPDWEYRYYSFNSKWDKAERMASMRDGSGDGYYALFINDGVIIKGFERSSPFSKYFDENDKPFPGIFDNVPGYFTSFLKEPAFVLNETTFCIWRTSKDKAWRSGELNAPVDVLDNPIGLLNIFIEKAEGYHRWAQEYYETSLSLSDIQYFFDNKPITLKSVTALNPGATIEDLSADIREIGYPALHQI